MSTIALLRASAPAIFLALFAGAAGTFTGGATAAGAMAGHAAVLAAALYGAPAWRDPLGLGRWGRWLPVLVLGVVLASWAASPVRRAGLVAVLTLPAWLLVPAAVARCWRRPRERARGLVAVAVVVLAVAATGLWSRWGLGDPRAALPLGHHNLLAVWLLTLLPLAAVPALRGAVRDGGRSLFAAHRAAGLVGAVAGLTGLAALVATGSLSGVLGLGVAGVMLAASLARGGHGRWRWGTLGVAVAAVAALLLPVLPRLGALATGTDPSLAARRTYWAAGWQAFLERPFFGWGPGSVPWTVGGWMRPVPGVNPPGEVVGDLHSSPLHLAFEVGGSGLLLIVLIALLFIRRRWTEARDRTVTAAALLGLLGAGTALLAVAPLAVTAVPAAVAVAAGAALAAGGEGGRRPAPPARWPVVLPVILYVILVLVLLGRLDLAHLHYDRAVAGDASTGAHLAAAVRLDPAFPLYRARLARLRGDGEAALIAARGAPGLGALWLSAGELVAAGGPEPEDGDGAAALEMACRLDPLSAAAPFLLARREPAAQAAPRRLGRALLAEPRLAAALWLEGREELLEAALAEMAGWPGVTAGWRRAMLDAVTGWDVEVSGEVGRLRVVADGTADAASLSLHAFRRRPWRFELASFPVRLALARQVDLPPATTLPETAPEAFAGGRGCAP